MDLHDEAVERLAFPVQRLPDAQHPTVVDAELPRAVPGCDAEGQLRVGAWWGGEKKGRERDFIPPT